MKVTFYKMHGAGNDYIFIDALSSPPPCRLPYLARVLSKRHFGVGGDGLVVMLPSDQADARMQMFNADGSEGRMCGNAIRCMGAYLFAKAGGDRLSIDTPSGRKNLILHKQTRRIWVDMGEVFPIRSPKMGVPFFIRMGKIAAFPMSVGNPHLVCFVPPDATVTPKEIHTLTVTMPCFREGINIEVAKVKDRGTAQACVWERGSGETLSCGTGAVAVAAVGMAEGLFHKAEAVDIRFPGGTLTVVQDKYRHFWLGGETKFVYKGEMEIEDAL